MTTSPYAEPTRARYAAALLPLVTDIVHTVHEEDQHAVRTAIARALAFEHRRPTGVDPVEAVITILAAAIDPAVTIEQALGWVRGLRPAPPPPSGADHLIDLCAAGHVPADELTPDQRLEVARRLTDQGLDAAEIAARMGVERRTVERYRHHLSAA